MDRNLAENGREGRLPAKAPLANAYVPFQSEKPPRYEARTAMVRGTLFPGLELPFMGMVNQKKKKVIYGALDQKYEILKQQTKTIVNQEKIEELMNELLKQKEVEMEELDSDRVQEVESLLEEVREELAELKRQQEESERRRQAEEERKRKEEEQRLERERKEKENLRRQQEEAERRRIESEQKRQAELKRQREEAEQKRKAEEDRKLAEQQRLERERLEREEAERKRIAMEERKRQEELRRQQAEEQRRREEEARRPRGIYGQQIFDYIQRTGTPTKKIYATVAKNRNVIVPTTLYTDPNQLPPKYRQYFSIITSEQN